MKCKMDAEKLLKDYNPEEGLMDKIQELIKPPTLSPSASVKSKPKHEYYKFPGKAHNRDRCDACSGVGDLLCCDQCPASFHFQCCDPPLEFEDLSSEWMCHNCTVNAKKSLSNGFNNGKNSDSVKQFVKSSTKRRVFPSSSSLSRQSRKSRGRIPAKYKWELNSNSGLSSPSSDSEKVNNVEIKTEVVNDTHIPEVSHDSFQHKPPNCLFSELILSIRNSNPEEFELPGIYCTNEPLPGTSWYNQRRKRFADNELPTSSIKRPYTFEDTSLVPMPAKLCYICSKTCRIAPLIQCDYCSTVFHLDCLNPPLTSLPQGRWMCPNHPDHANPMEAFSKSWTRRVRFYEYCRQPVDEIQVKLDFLLKARRHWPPWKNGYSSPDDEFIKVPPSIKSMYENPRSLNEGDFYFEKRNSFSNEQDAKLSQEQNLFISSLIEIQLSFVRSQLKTAHCILPNNDASSNLTIEESHLKSDNQTESKLQTESTDFDTLLCSENIVSTDCSEEKTTSPVTNSSGKFESASSNSHIVALEESVLDNWTLESLSHLDPSLILLLAKQRINQLGFLPSPKIKTLLNKRECSSLYSIEYESVVLHMTSNHVTIGSAHGSDLCLSNLRHCSFTSPQHAAIFYDEVNDVFEIINYSEFGTIVDNVIYGITSSSSDPLECVDGPSLTQFCSMSESPSPSVFPTCRCTQSPSEPHAWEGSAVLTHGSTVRFGCHAFVFSTMNEASDLT